MDRGQKREKAGVVVFGKCNGCLVKTRPTGEYMLVLGGRARRARDARAGAGKRRRREQRPPGGSCETYNGRLMAAFGDVRACPIQARPWLLPTDTKTCC